jgi:hypothetical protein
MEIEYDKPLSFQVVVDRNKVDDSAFRLRINDINTAPATDVEVNDETNIATYKFAVAKVRAGQMIQTAGLVGKTFPVILDANEGELRGTVTSHTFGEATALPTRADSEDADGNTPVKKGFAFQGWYNNEDLSGSAIDAIEANIGTVNNLGTTDKTVVGAINEVIAKIATDDAATLAAAKKYTDDEFVEFKDGDFATLSGKVTANTNKLEGIDTTVKAAIEAAKTAAAEDASNKAAATLASAQTYAEEKATAAQSAAKTYTDGEIDKVESTVSKLEEKVDNHIAIAITGAKDANDNLTLSLGDKELVIVFNCGSATEVI